MGCGASTAAKGPRPQVQSSASPGVEITPGQAAIIRNYPNAHLNGKRVICEEYNASLGEWLVKGEKFPLSVGMSLGVQFLDVQPEVQRSEPLQPAPTLLSNGGCSVKFVRGKHQELLKTKLEEKYNAMLDCSKEDVGAIVSDVHEHADGIIQKGSGLGPSGDCPFASADEVHLYCQFCLNVFTKWAEHKMGQDEHMDKKFFSQIDELCVTLSFLDTDAVPLPEGTEQIVQLVQRDGLFPNWVRGQTPKGEAAVRHCLVIGKKWQLEETEAFQKALASLESNK